MQILVESEQKLEDAALNIIEFAGDQRIWLFFGEMGVGKTTLIKAIAASFGVDDRVHSPSFNLVNEYRNHKNAIFYHFDFYRIKSETEALDIGLDEYFDSGSLCLVEWPQKISGLIPAVYLGIDLSILADNSRLIKLNHHGK